MVSLGLCSVVTATSARRRMREGVRCRQLNLGAAVGAWKLDLMHAYPLYCSRLYICGNGGVVCSRCHGHDVFLGMSVLVITVSSVSSARLSNLCASVSACLRFNCSLIPKLAPTSIFSCLGTQFAPETCRQLRLPGSHRHCLRFSSCIYLVIVAFQLRC